MKDQSVRVAIWIIATLLTCYAIYFARTLIAPLVVAGLLYLTLRPIVCGLERLRVPPVASACLLLVLFLGILVAGIFTVIDPARGWLASLPNHLETLGQKLDSIHSPFHAIDEASEEVESLATSDADDEPVEVQVQQPKWISQWYLVNGTSSIIGFLVLTLVMVFFLLATGDRLINSMLHILPTFHDRRTVVELILELQHGVSSYLGQVTLINIGLGVAVSIAMAVVGMPSPLLWGTMATLLNFIPFVGALLGATTIFLAAAITFEPLSAAFLTVGVYLTLTTLEGNFITPALLGKTLQLSPLMVLLSLAFWGWMWGLVGIFVAVPLLVVARLSFEHFERTHPLAVLLGAEDKTAPQGKADENSSDEQKADSEQTEADKEVRVGCRPLRLPSPPVP